MSEEIRRKHLDVIFYVFHFQLPPDNYWNYLVSVRSVPVTDFPAKSRNYPEWENKYVSWYKKPFSPRTFITEAKTTQESESDFLLKVPPPSLPCDSSKQGDSIDLSAITTSFFTFLSILKHPCQNNSLFSISLETSTIIPYTNLYYWAYA